MPDRLRRQKAFVLVLFGTIALISLAALITQRQTSGNLEADSIPTPQAFIPSSSQPVLPADLEVFPVPSSSRLIYADGGSVGNVQWEVSATSDEVNDFYREARGDWTFSSSLQLLSQSVWMISKDRVTFGVLTISSETPVTVISLDRGPDYRFLESPTFVVPVPSGASFDPPATLPDALPEYLVPPQTTALYVVDDGTVVYASWTSDLSVAEAIAAFTSQLTLASQVFSVDTGGGGLVTVRTGSAVMYFAPLQSGCRIGLEAKVTP
jgi:hypothetical protein